MHVEPDLDFVLCCRVVDWWNLHLSYPADRDGDGGLNPAVHAYGQGRQLPGCDHLQAHGTPSAWAMVAEMVEHSATVERRCARSSRCLSSSPPACHHRMRVLICTVIHTEVVRVLLSIAQAHGSDGAVLAALLGRQQRAQGVRGRENAVDRGRAVFGEAAHAAAVHGRSRGCLRSGAAHGGCSRRLRRAGRSGRLPARDRGRCHVPQELISKAAEGSPRGACRQRQCVRIEKQRQVLSQWAIALRQEKLCWQPDVLRISAALVIALPCAVDTICRQISAMSVRFAVQSWQ
eukprot:SAG25_NODE_1_length_41698_cov_149.842015_14_plen_290_part_00